MHFGTKSYLKSTRNHTAKHALCLWLRPQIFFMVACMCQKLSSRLKGYNNTQKKKFHLLGEHNFSRDRFSLPSAITSLFK
jgi:hypothetical protein